MSGRRPVGKGFRVGESFPGYPVKLTVAGQARGWGDPGSARVGPERLPAVAGTRRVWPSVRSRTYRTEPIWWLCRSEAGCRVALGTSVSAALPRAGTQAATFSRNRFVRLILGPIVSMPALGPSRATTDSGERCAHFGLAVLALAMGGFAIGTTEFVTMGLLPQIAGGVDVDIPAAGHVISAYALGVVVGAPVLAFLGARLPRRGLLIGLMIAFALGNAASALAASYGFLTAARFASGLPHGAYFGVASLVAASLATPARKGRAVALVMLGLSVANVVGVPAATWMGQHLGWRSAYVAVAGRGVGAAGGLPDLGVGLGAGGQPAAAADDGRGRRPDHRCRHEPRLPQRRQRARRLARRARDRRRLRIPIARPRGCRALRRWACRPARLGRPSPSYDVGRWAWRATVARQLRARRRG